MFGIRNIFVQGPQERCLSPVAGLLSVLFLGGDCFQPPLLQSCFTSYSPYGCQRAELLGFLF
jgi:hypothetical protein